MFTTAGVESGDPDEGSGFDDGVLAVSVEFIVVLVSVDEGAGSVYLDPESVVVALEATGAIVSDFGAGADYDLTEQSLLVSKFH